jgi:PiT family inorganic phosphate transporter
MGVGIVSGGMQAIQWGKVWGIVASWIISPIFSGILAFSVFMLINKAILQKENAVQYGKRYAPFFIGITFFIILLSFFLKTPLGKTLDISTEKALLFSFIVSFGIGIIGYMFIRERKIQNVEQIFKILQIITSCYVGFAVGANDVANAIGPVAAIRNIAITGKISTKVPVPFFLLAFGGVGIVIGTLTWGYRIIKTVGFKITALTNTRGFSIDFGAATSVLIASKLGLPVSTTHAVVGAVIGVGLARGIEAIDLKVIKNIILSWFVTLPIAGGIASLIFMILK